MSQPFETRILPAPPGALALGRRTGWLLAGLSVFATVQADLGPALSGLTARASNASTVFWSPAGITPSGQKTNPYRNINILASKVRVLFVHPTVSFLNFLWSRERDIDSNCHSVQKLPKASWLSNLPTQIPVSR